MVIAKVGDCDEVNQGESEQDVIDGTKNGTDSTVR